MQTPLTQFGELTLNLDINMFIRAGHPRSAGCLTPDAVRVCCNWQEEEETRYDEKREECEYPR